jgi:hypothetical protein
MPRRLAMARATPSSDPACLIGNGPGLSGAVFSSTAGQSRPVDGKNPGIYTREFSNLSSPGLKRSLVCNSSPPTLCSVPAASGSECLSGLLR